MDRRLALHGGTPVRSRMLPYGRQWIDDADVEAVTRVLRSDWLTTGPAVDAFERAFAATTDTTHAVAVSNGTAALHTMMHVLGVQPGDEVIVPSLTFAATSNCVLYQGGTPRFVDVDPGTLLIDPSAVADFITARTRAIVAVDYAGQPADYHVLRSIAAQHGLSLVADACHALGGNDAGRPVGSLADITAFSLHPVKHITAGEGGVVTTDHPDLASRARRFRNHGITMDHRARQRAGAWFYEMVELGYNYRLTDIQCALATSQLAKLESWVCRRRHIAREYDEQLPTRTGLQPLEVRDGAYHAYHLYVVQLMEDAWRIGRDEVFAALRAEGIGVNVHYTPVHLHPYYRDRLSTDRGMCPVAEAAYDRILSLPIFPHMTDADVTDVLTACEKVFAALRA